jgi:hypothetical protein
MKTSYQRFLIPGLAVLCGIAVLTLIPALHLPSAESGKRPDAVRSIPAPSLDALKETPPSMQEVAAKHLFIPDRKATGQNAFPDLAVKGVFLGTERSVVFSLKSKPQANLRVWQGRTDSALSQIVDPKDLRQPIAQFLREWNIKEISFSEVKVEHFITGEVQTYAVNYTPEKKVKDDASRGYGQGIIPQGGDGSGPSAVARTATGNNTAPSGQQAGAPPASQMADRVSAIIQRMSPDQRKQFLKQVQQSVTGGNQNNSAASRQPATQNTPANSKNSKTSTTQSSKKTK